MIINLNDNCKRDDNFLKAVNMSYINLEKQIRTKQAVIYMIYSWKELYNSSLPTIEEINNEYLFSEEELKRIFHIFPGRDDIFSNVLKEFAARYVFFINKTKYYSLPKIIETYWVLERIVPLTMFWEEGEFGKGFDYE
jgi:hypothetical protein